MVLWFNVECLWFNFDKYSYKRYVLKLEWKIEGERVVRIKILSWCVCKELSPNIINRFLFSGVK